MSTIQLRADGALKPYLARVGYVGRPAPDLATLAELNRLHLLAFPYENIDIQIGRRVTRCPKAAFRKLVEEGRGGWCFEYNGLFAWMLETIGFRVHHLAGAVMREAAGDKVIGNHLVPVVELDGFYLVDVAMGVPQPVPLAVGAIEQDWRRYALEQPEPGWWRFRNHPGALPPSFDFTFGLESDAILDAASDWLQREPGSPFVRHAIVQRFFPDRMETLVGPMHTVIDASGERTTELATREAYGKAVRENFGLYVPDLKALWERVSRAPRTGFLDGLEEAA